jgi:hypothetical protein
VNSALYRFIEWNPTSWLEDLVNDYKIIANTAGDLVSLKYDQINSPMREPVVQECRGAVVRISTGEILALPYRKFWNLGEPLADRIDWSTARVQDKLDGSLMIMYFDEELGDWAVASSGHPIAGGGFGTNARTFADAFWSIFDCDDYGCMGKPEGTLREFCYMFELISPANRIVCKYDRPELILHGARCMVSGQEVDRGTLEKLAHRHGWEIVKEYPITNEAECIAAAAALDPTRHEGFIVVDARFNRVKVKSPRYVALHHLRGNGPATRRRAIELWQAGEVGELLTHFPEMSAEVQPVLNALDRIGLAALSDFTVNFAAPSRKDFALAVKDAPWAGVTFALYKNHLDNGGPLSAADVIRKMSITPVERMVGAVLGKEPA